LKVAPGQSCTLPHSVWKQKPQCGQYPGPELLVNGCLHRPHADSNSFVLGVSCPFSSSSLSLTISSLTWPMAGDSKVFMGEERLVEVVVVVVTIGLAVVVTAARIGGGEGGVTFMGEGRISPFRRGIGRTGLAAEPTA
jgi:hypothetical protein